MFGRSKKTDTETEAAPEIDLGANILYRSTDSKGVERWRKGVVHSVKKAEAVTGPDIVLGYLIDTGKDERVDEVTTTAADRELNKRVEKHVSKGATIPEAVEKSLAQGDLPEGGEETEVTRYPQQIEVKPEDLRLDAE